MEKARKPDVVDKAPAPLQQRPILDAQHTLTEHARKLAHGRLRARSQVSIHSSVRAFVADNVTSSTTRTSSWLMIKSANDNEVPKDVSTVDNEPPYVAYSANLRIHGEIDDLGAISKSLGLKPTHV